MCLELENAREAVTSALSQRAVAAADAESARESAGREISALTARAEELAAHLETACNENSILSAKLRDLLTDNTSLQVAKHLHHTPPTALEVDLGSVRADKSQPQLCGCDCAVVVN